MEIDRALRLSSRAVALSGLFSLLLTGEAAYWLLGPAFAVALMGAVSRRLARPVLSPRTVTALTVLCAAFAVLDFFYISGSLILAGADFLVLLLCLKLLSLERHKDYIQLCAVAFFILLASTGLSTDVYFLAAFLFFFISLTWALILLTIKGEAGGEEGRAGRLRIGRLFFTGTAGLTLLATLFTAVIFLIIPRVGVGYFSRKAGGLLKSGFSDKVELSSGGEVLLDPAAVMRVEFPGMEGKPEGPLYFRGRVFDAYDGRGWTGSAPVRRALFRSPDGAFHPSAGRGVPGALRQDITLEPADSPVLFSVYPPVSVSGDVRAVFEDGFGALYLPSPPDGRLRYSVLSGSGPGREAQSEAGEGFGRYLQMPEGSERLRRLAQEVSGNAAGDAGKARRLENYLQANYSYSLNPPRASGDAVENFLFKTKAGYCVHFATAMALMLRSQGIPARLVSGFLGGEWNGYGRYLLVRQEDAHTWVEAWLPGRGWTAIDPTPAGGRAGRNLFGGLLGAADFLKYKWDRWVVYYNLRDQAGAAKKIFSAFQSAREKIADADRRLRFNFDTSGLKGAGKKLAFLPVLVSMAVLAVFFVRRYPRRSFRKGGARPRVDFYDEAVRMLRDRGLMRSPGETPLQFAGGLVDRYGDRFSAFGYLTGVYNGVRFGARRIGPAEEKQVREALRSLKASLKDTAPGRRV